MPKMMRGCVAIKFLNLLARVLAAAPAEQAPAPAAADAMLVYAQVLLVRVVLVGMLRGSRSRNCTGPQSNYCTPDSLALAGDELVVC